MATSIDDNAADEKLDKSIWRLLNIHCTKFPKIQVFTVSGKRSKKFLYYALGYSIIWYDYRLLSRYGK